MKRTVAVSGDERVVLVNMVQTRATMRKLGVSEAFGVVDIE